MRVLIRQMSYWRHLWLNQTLLYGKGLDTSEGNGKKVRSKWRRPAGLYNYLSLVTEVWSLTFISVSKAEKLSSESVRNTLTQQSSSIANNQVAVCMRVCNGLDWHHRGLEVLTCNNDSRQEDHRRLFCAYTLWQKLSQVRHDMIPAESVSSQRVVKPWLCGEKLNTSEKLIKQRSFFSIKLNT